MAFRLQTFSQKHVGNIVNKLDYNRSYYNTCENETAQTETAKRFHQSEFESAVDSSPSSKDNSKCKKQGGGEIFA